MRPLLDLQSLQCFVEAARLGNFRAAARVCALSATAFSDRIRRLEEQLGASLFERTTRRIQLTVAGHRLLDHAKHTLSHADACYSATSSSTPEFSLTLGTRYELGMSFIVPHLAKLERNLPERVIHLRFGDSPDLVTATQRGELDAAVTSARLASVGLDSAALHEERYSFVASPSMLAERPLRAAEDASRHALFDINEDLPLFRYFLETEAGQRPWNFVRIVHLGTIAAIRHRVLEGAGAAVLPLYFVRDDLQKKRLVRLFPKLKLRTDCFRLVWRRGHPRSDELRALATELAASPLR